MRTIVLLIPILFLASCNQEKAKRERLDAIDAKAAEKVKTEIIANKNAEETIEKIPEEKQKAEQMKKGEPNQDQPKKDEPKKDEKKSVGS